ncbi:trigger factor [Bacteroidota bacterium]
MNITKENLDELNAIMKIQIEEKDYSERVEEVLKDYRKKVTLDGFRPGKVPAGLVRKMYRTPVMVEEINKLVTESISNFLKEEEIKILGEPLPSEKQQKEIDWENQSEFEFDFDLGLAPKFEISLSQKDKIIQYEIQIDKKMIDETKESYAGRMGSMTPVDQVEESESLTGDFQQIDKEGNPIEGGILSEDAQFSLTVIKDDKTKTAFVARQVGEFVDLDIRKAFPNETEISSLLKIDKSAVPEIAPNFRFTIKNISKFQKAEINQELFDKLYGKDEVKSMEEFEVKISDELKKGLSRDSEYRFSIDAKKAILKKFKFDLPVEFLKRWLVLANEDKFTAEQINEDFPKFEDDLKWQLIRDQIVKDQEIKVESEELKAAAREMALMQFQQYGIMDVPEENLENYASEMLKNEEERRRSYDSILEKKVMGFISDSVKVDNKQITIEKFNKLFENN